MVNNGSRSFLLWSVWFPAGSNRHWQKHRRSPAGARPARRIFSDFHLGDDGPQLIEINTSTAARSSTTSLPMPKPPAAVKYSHCCVRQAMPRNCRNNGCRCSGRSGAVSASRIVHDQSLSWMRHRQPNTSIRIPIVSAPVPTGWRALCDHRARRIALAKRAALHGDRVIDLVYNRLTDFTWNSHKPGLQAAYQAGAVVLTPTRALMHCTPTNGI